MTSDFLALAGDPAVMVHLRRSARARSMSLRVSRLDGRVTLTVPGGVPVRDIQAFLAEKAPWVRGHLERTPPQVLVRAGVRLPVEGQGVVLEAAATRTARRDGARLFVSAPRAGAQARSYLQDVARARLGARCLSLSGRLGRDFGSLVLRDTRSRWGSCSSSGRLMFSWRLAMAPPRILDYVAAHEVAHLEEMNHSKAFWRLVARLHPDFEADRHWLREHGTWMHRYRFEEDRG